MQFVSPGQGSPGNPRFVKKYLKKRIEKNNLICLTTLFGVFIIFIYLLNLQSKSTRLKSSTEQPTFILKKGLDFIWWDLATSHASAFTVNWTEPHAYFLLVQLQFLLLNCSICLSCNWNFQRRKFTQAKAFVRKKTHSRWVALDSPAPRIPCARSTSSMLWVTNAWMEATIWNIFMSLYCNICTCVL